MYLFLLVRTIQWHHRLRGRGNNGRELLQMWRYILYSTIGVLVPYTRSGGSKQSFSTKNFAKIIRDRHPMQKNRLCLIREWNPCLKFHTNTELKMLFTFHQMHDSTGVQMYTHRENQLITLHVSYRRPQLVMRAVGLPLVSVAVQLSGVSLIQR